MTVSQRGRAGKLSFPALKSQTPTPYKVQAVSGYQERKLLALHAQL